MRTRPLIKAALATLLLAALPAAAQQRSEGPARQPQTSLQTQLGAIPLVSPRALQQASRMRTVKLTQLSETGLPVSEPREIACPETGCQQTLALDVGGKRMPFMADIQFVGHGAYVSLQVRAIEVGAVVEFEKGRRGPLFVKGRSDEAMAQTLRYALAPSLVMRRLDIADDGKTITAGNLYTRKLSPDVVLRVEIGALREK